MAALGVTVKSGWASAVLVSGASGLPQIIDSRWIDLSDPVVPESRQPYHDGFGTARRRGPELSRLIASVKRFGRRSLTDLIQHHEKSGYQLRGVGIVVGSLINPEQIGNEHIRIHALEGRLFRRVVEDASARRGLPHVVWRDRNLYLVGAAMLNRSEAELHALLTTLGKTRPAPWRAEQKTAALAAWLALVGGLSSGPEENQRGNGRTEPTLGGLRVIRKR